MKDKNVKDNETVSKQIWIFFSSVKLTVYLLLLLAVTSIIGTVVLQNGSPDQYVRLYGKGGYNLIKVFDVDDMYQAWWFLLLLVMLCVNIVVCSVERLSLTWKIIFPKQVKFNPGRFLGAKSAQTFTLDAGPKQAALALEKHLAQKVGPVSRTVEDDRTLLYAEKGRWTRLGVYVVHASVLLLLIGALIGSLFGFKAGLRLDEGQSSGKVFEAKTRLPIRLPFEVRCNEFEVQFYDTGAPKLFRSNLTVIENGEDRFTRDITMNNPLRYKGINIFQSSYGTAPPKTVAFMIIDNQSKKEVEHTVRVGQTIQLPEGFGSFEYQGFMPHFDFRGNNLGEAIFGKIKPREGEAFQIGLPVKFPTFDKMRKGRFAFVVKAYDKSYYTGLQVTKDPGVPYVYAGFILMILGCWVTFFMSHQSYFISVDRDSKGLTRVVLSGKTNRNHQGMKLKLKKMATQIKDISV